MGLYTFVKEKGKEGQVKCWDDEISFISIGDKVPDIDGESSYLIAMREGGFLIVFKNTLIAWEDKIPAETLNWPLFDKWGTELRLEALDKAVHGLSGHEKYFFQ